MVTASTTLFDPNDERPLLKGVRPRLYTASEPALDSSDYVVGADSESDVEITGVTMLPKENFQHGASARSLAHSAES